MPRNRRSFLKNAALGLTGLAVASSDVKAQEPPKSASGARRGNPIAVSSYSYWHFADEDMPMDVCLRMAADAGFDAFEVLEKQLHRVDMPYLKSLRRDAFKYGLSLCCMSTHQTFVRPDAEEREKNIEITKNSVEMAAEMGIPAIRIYCFLISAPMRRPLPAARSTAVHAFFPSRAAVSFMADLLIKDAGFR